MIIMISGVGSEFEIERFKVEGGGGGLVLSEILTSKKRVCQTLQKKVECMTQPPPP